LGASINTADDRTCGRPWRIYPPEECDAERSCAADACPYQRYGYCRAKIKELLGKLTRAPITGSEIAIIAPTLAYHHLPHLDCDVAEFLRKQGAKTNMIGLARGVGKRICQLTAYERDLINEHDVAVFVLGNYEHCIIEKSKNFMKG